MNEKIKYQLESKGFCNIDNISTVDNLLNFANSIGKVLPHPNGSFVDTLTPSDGKKSSKGSFSYKFGYGAFPLHTDTAFWAKPTRYMILYSEFANSCNSLVISSESFLSNLSLEEYDLANSAIFLVKTFNGQHYTSLLFKEENTIGFRFDPCCMFPVNSAAKEILICYYEYFEKNRPKRINWIGKNAVIIDNWKMLHGRSKAEKNKKRIINRIYLENIL